MSERTHKGGSGRAGAAAASKASAVRPRLRPGVLLAYDGLRGTHVLLSPERVLVLNETAAAVVRRCGGGRSVAAITAELRTQYGGVRATEVLGLLRELTRRRLLAQDGSGEAIS